MTVFKGLTDYLLTNGDAASQFLNASLFFSGNANQSLSGRCWEERDHWLFGSLLFVIDGVALMIFRKSDHCRKAYESDMRRAKRRMEQARG